MVTAVMQEHSKRDSWNAFDCFTLHSMHNVTEHATRAFACVGGAVGVFYHNGRLCDDKRQKPQPMYVSDQSATTGTQGRLLRQQIGRRFGGMLFLYTVVNACAEMLDEENCIVEVEKRQTLYQIILNYYSSRELKVKFWMELCTSTEMHWNGGK
jgi:hypothetical protein